MRVVTVACVPALRTWGLGRVRVVAVLASQERALEVLMGWKPW